MRSFRARHGAVVAGSLSSQRAMAFALVSRSISA